MLYMNQCKGCIVNSILEEDITSNAQKLKLYGCLIPLQKKELLINV